MTEEVKWIDDDGYKHLSIMPQKFKLHNPSEGFPNDPPNLDLIDWDLVKKELHNLLVDRRIVTFADLQNKNGDLANAILLVIRPKLVELYKKQMEVRNA